MSTRPNQIEQRIESAERVNGTQSFSRSAARQQPAKRTLSPRQTDIARLVASGLTDKEIANELGLTEATIGWYLSEIFHKWQIHSRIALATRFLRDVNGSSPP